MEDRIARLEAELEALKQQIRSLAPLAGLPLPDESWQVSVGGETVQIRALTPAQWVIALQDLPGFLFTYAANEAAGGAPQEETLERLIELARQWIIACAINPAELRLERLTIPEALEAVKTISRLNGIDAQLGEMLKKKLMPSTRSTKQLDAMG